MDFNDIENLFAAPHRETYYNTAGIALMPDPVRRDAAAYLDAHAEQGFEAFKEYSPRVDALRKGLAEMMGAWPEEIALTRNTAEGVGIIANGLDWQEGDKVMTLNREYPSTVYPWMWLERRRGVELIMLEEKEGRLDEEEICAAIRREEPRLFAISAVEWCSGWRFNLQEIGRACREVGTFFFVDAAQCLGFHEMDVRSCHISAMAGSGWKWLMGPPGEGYLYLRRGLLDTIQPTFVGSDSVVNPLEYLDYDLTFQPGMKRFEFSTTSLLNRVWFESALRFLRQIGLDEVRRHVFGLQDYAAERLTELGCELRGVPSDHERRSGIMSFCHPAHDSRELSKRLGQSGGFNCPERDGCVRISFHIHNTERGLDRLIETLRGLLA